MTISQLFTPKPRLPGRLMKRANLNLATSGIWLLAAIALAMRQTDWPMVITFAALSVAYLGIGIRKSTARE